MSDFLKSKWLSIVFGILLLILFYILSAFIFAAVFYFTKINREYIPFFSNLGLAVSSFLSVFLITRKKGDKGLLTGFIIGGITFILLFVISLFIQTGVTFNTLFRFLFIMLPASIGGIMGVNRTNKIM